MEDQKSPEDEDIQQQVTELRKWLEEKPYVPKNLDEKLYRRFVRSCYYDLDKAKTAADLFFSFRSTEPELMTDRDPLSPNMQKTFKITKFGRYRISGKRNLWVWQWDDPGLRQYDHLLDVKLFILTTDAWLLEDDFLEEDNVVLSDVKDLCIRILTKFSYSLLKKMTKYQQEAVPLRLTQIHLVNAPSVIYRVFALMKPFISKDMMKMMHIHTPKSTTLYDYFNKEDLPAEFGGTRGKISDYADETVSSIIKNREYLIDDNLWRCDPSTSKKEKVDNKPVPDTTAEISSLRTLAID